MVTLKIDPWAASYESALQIDDDEPRTDVPVDPKVETEDWHPIQPPPARQPESVAFIDGVQRVELRVVGEEDGKLVYGAFCSIAAGAAVMRPGASAFGPGISRRIVALGGGLLPEPWTVPCGTADIHFQPESSPDSGPDAWQGPVRNVRRQIEKRLGEQMLKEGHPLVAVDGRLTFQPSRTSHAIGIAKSIRTMYLKPPHSAILAQLQRGTRTPVFAIQYGEDGADAFYSWYVRLSDPRLMDHGWAGIVQVETSARIGVEAAVRLADLTAAWLPAFASEHYRDARAPQNMLPIGALEQRLRHELGDHEWIRRNLEACFRRKGETA
jgi:uncharacterized protein